MTTQSLLVVLKRVLQLVQDVRSVLHAPRIIGPDGNRLVGREALVAGLPGVQQLDQALAEQGLAPALLELGPDLVRPLLGHVVSPHDPDGEKGAADRYQAVGEPHPGHHALGL